MKICAAFFTFLLVTSSAFAGESTFSLGPLVNTSFQFHNGTHDFDNPLEMNNPNKIIYSIKKFPLPSISMGISGVVPLNDDGKLALGFNIGLSHFRAFGEMKGETYNHTLENGDRVVLWSRFTNDLKQTSISTEFNLRYKPFNQNSFGISGGVATAYIVYSYSHYRHELVFNEAYTGVDFKSLHVEPIYTVHGFKSRFTDDFSTALLLYQGDTPNLNLFQINMLAGLFYDINYENCIISPNIYYSFPLTGIVSSQEWQVSQLFVSVDMRFIF